MFSASKAAPGRAAARDDRLAASPAASAFCFSLQSLPEPGVMARMLEQFAKRGLMPTRWFGDVDAETGLLQVDIQVAGLPAAQGEAIGRGLRAIVGVHQVLTGSKTAG
ncbi:MAG: hypothetical protein AB7S71_15510 [Dongiaceae bacterium]